MEQIMAKKIGRLTPDKHKAMGGGSPSPKGGGELVIGTRDKSNAAQSRGQSADMGGGNAVKGKSIPSGGTAGITSTHMGMTNAGDAGAGVGGGHKLGNHYSNK